MAERKKSKASKKVASKKKPKATPKKSATSVSSDEKVEVTISRSPKPAEEKSTEISITAPAKDIDDSLPIKPEEDENLPAEIPQPTPDVIKPTPPKAKTVSRKKISKKKVVVVLVVLLIVGAFIATRGKNKDEVADAVKEIEKVAVLPEEERPILSTVTNEEDINQPFLQGARNGDQLLVYNTARRAVLYRPSTKQVVAMGPLQSTDLRVFIRNGTSKSIDTIVARVNQEPGFVVTSKDASSKNDYKKTVVVDVTGNTAQAKQLAQIFNGEVVGLPEGESTPPNVDLLLIYGAD